MLRSRTEGQGGPRFHGGEQLRQRTLLTCGGQGAIPAMTRSGVGERRPLCWFWARGGVNSRLVVAPEAVRQRKHGGAASPRRRRGRAEAGERLGSRAATAVEVGCRGCGCGLKRRGPEIWACGMGRGITARITAVIREAVERGRVGEGGPGKRARMVSGARRGRGRVRDQAVSERG